MSRFLYTCVTVQSHLLHSEHMCVIIFVTTSKGVTDMQDTTLLDRNEPITMDGLRSHFRKHDFSTQTSGYKFKTASSEKNQMYLKAKGFFRTSWEQKMKKLCKKVSSRTMTKLKIAPPGITAQHSVCNKTTTAGGKSSPAARFNLWRKAYDENPNVGKCITNLKRSPGA